MSLNPDPLQAWDDADDMCPNCVTPWKCNGPHLADETPYMRRLLSANRRSPFRGCSVLGFLLIVLLASVVPAPREADQLRGWRPLQPGTPPAVGRPLGASGRWAPSLVQTGAPQVLAAAGRSGTWAYADRSHGSLYLAIPEGKGWDVTVCGPLRCLDRVSTDAGPALYLQRAGRIGDLSATTFIEICGPLSAGLCAGSYTITGAADQSGDDPPEHPDDRRMRLEDGGPAPTLPPTDAVK